MHRRPYFFEVLTLANFALLDAVLRHIGLSAFIFLGTSFVSVLPVLLLQAAAGIVVRAVIDRRRGRDYLRAVGTPRFLTDLARMAIMGVLWVHIYGWLKVAVPALNSRLWDQFFWNLDRALFFNLSPNVFFVQLFSHPLALRAVDWTYANVFAASLVIGGAFFLSHPDPHVRVGFFNANSTMWIAGAWLYVAFPCFDPCYRFPEIWLPLTQYLPQTQFLQRLLMTNYQNFTHMAQRPAPISLFFGLSAFPSLHTAYVFLVFLWMRGLSRWARLLFGAFTVIIFIGSLVTGWHYLSDALAGLLLAALCYATRLE